VSVFDAIGQSHIIELNTPIAFESTSTKISMESFKASKLRLRLATSEVVQFYDLVRVALQILAS